MRNSQRCDNLSTNWLADKNLNFPVNTKEYFTLTVFYASLHLLSYIKRDQLIAKTILSFLHASTYLLLECEALLKFSWVAVDKEPFWRSYIGKHGFCKEPQNCVL
jgi:hypothetical protein